MSKAQTRAVLALGGNIGDVAEAFVQALSLLASNSCVRLIARSGVYRTAPWGVTEQPDFLNMAVLVETSLRPRALLDLALSIERASGRVRDLRWGPRSLDIDVITYGDETIDEPDLTIPHPRLAERAFVLVPLADIAPDLEFGGIPVRELLTKVDASGVSPDAEAQAKLVAAGF
ncbi:MAG: folK [Hyphomicrobiales bacterium]|nr:folK [Hyphomicrobiales bacterium]